MSFIKFLSISVLSVLLLGCQPKERGENEIYIGTISGPETQLMEVVKHVAEKEGLHLKIIEFEDYITPNSALEEGSIDANMFQHLPYLQVFNTHRNYQIEPIGETFVYPMGIYSKKYTNLSKIPIGATFGIPNDPSNGARALRLLSQSKLINIPEKDDFNLRPKDIFLNPYQIVIKELDAAQLPRALDDLDFAIINTNYAIPAGLIPTEDAVFLEDKDSPYANIVVVRAQEKQKTKFKTLMRALHSEEVLSEAHRIFQGQAIPAWLSMEMMPE